MTAVAFCAGAVLLAAGCGGSGGHVALPAKNASPEEVVRAYVAALDAHDIPTARALLTPAHARYVSASVDSWFTNVTSIKHLRVNKPFTDPYETRARHFRSCVDLGVHFVLEQHRAMSMPNGPTTWGYILCRDRTSERWRIADEGTG